MNNQSIPKVEIRNIVHNYNGKTVLNVKHRVFEKAGIHAVLGQNGSGKSTILKSIFGLLKPWTGRIAFNDSFITGSNPVQIKKMGITYYPQNNRIFKGLTVQENLDVSGIHLSKNDRVSRSADGLEIFPVLDKRLSSTSDKMSGGEQQMLSLAMALLVKPKLLLLDEPSIGLPPNMINKVFESIKKINPRIVYGSFYMYGDKGPLSHRRGGDIWAQAFTGMVATQGNPEEPPQIVSHPVLDVGGATLNALGILSALLYRERSGEGQEVTSNMVNITLVSCGSKNIIYSSPQTYRRIMALTNLNFDVIGKCQTDILK